MIGPGPPITWFMDELCYSTTYICRYFIFCGHLISTRTCSYSPRGSIDTKIIEIRVVPHLSSKFLGFGPELPKSMYFRGFFFMEIDQLLESISPQPLDGSISNFKV